MAAHSVGVWIWAAAFIGLGTFEFLEPALYFSVVSFTALGFGDITLSEQRRRCGTLFRHDCRHGLIDSRLGYPTLAE